MVQPSWERYRISRKTLRIKVVRLADSGVFVCKGVNGFGSESVALHLVVRGKEQYIPRVKLNTSLKSELFLGPGND